MLIVQARICVDVVTQQFAADEVIEKLRQIPAPDILIQELQAADENKLAEIIVFAADLLTRSPTVGDAISLARACRILDKVLKPAVVSSAHCEGRCCLCALQPCPFGQSHHHSRVQECPRAIRLLANVSLGSIFPNASSDTELVLIQELASSTTPQRSPARKCV